MGWERGETQEGIDEHMHLVFRAGGILCILMKPIEYQVDFTSRMGPESGKYWQDLYVDKERPLPFRRKEISTTSHRSPHLTSHPENEWRDLVTSYL